MNSSVEPERISLFTADGMEVSGLKVKSQSSGMQIEIPPTRSGIYILKIILKDGQVIAKKIIIR